MKKKTKKEIVVERRQLIINIVLGVIALPIFIWLNWTFVHVLFDEIGSVYSDGSNGSEDLTIWD